MKEANLEETSGMEQQTKGWMTTKLGNVLTLQRGFDLPSSKRYSGTIPVVSSSGITGNHNVARVQAPGVITGRYGTLGEVFLLLKDFWPLNTTLYVKDFKGNDPRFVYYLLESLDFRPFSDKSSVPGLNRNHLHELTVAIPSALSEQRAIAHILGTLDDKIELNRQMNQTLDEIARTLFRSWFVDFDPVRAKAAGRQPEGMDAETAALFPDRLVDSELGPIPEGWDVATIGDDYKVTMGQSPPGSTYNQAGDGVPFYQGRADFGFRFPGERVYCTAPTRFANAGDTLISVRAPVGDVNVALRNSAIGRGVAALRHRSNSESFTFHSAVALQPQLATFNAEGTVFGSINQKSLLTLQAVRVTDSLVDEFQRLVGPLDHLIKCNTEESSTLIELRDVLLPALLAGTLSTDDRS